LRRKLSERRRRRKPKKPNRRLAKVSYVLDRGLCWQLTMTTAAVTSGDGKKEEQPAPDEDPDGQKLLKTETPLVDALKVLAPLEKMAAGRIETWSMAYEIYRRRGQ
jgi:hypothetical protein